MRSQQPSLRIWILANVVGFAAAGMPWLAGAFFAYMVGMDRHDYQSWIMQAAMIGAAAGAAGGLILGGCQAFAWKGRLSTWTWLLVTVLGFAVGYAATIALLIVLQIEAYARQTGEFFVMGMAPFLVYLTDDLRRVAVVLLPSLVTGIGQWLLLRRTRQRAWHWLWSHSWASWVGLALILQFTGILNVLVSYFVPIGELTGAVVTGALAGLFYALVTAIAFSWMPEQTPDADRLAMEGDGNLMKQRTPVEAAKWLFLLVSLVLTVFLCRYFTTNAEAYEQTDARITAEVDAVRVEASDFMEDCMEQLKAGLLEEFLACYGPSRVIPLPADIPRDEIAKLMEASGKLESYVVRDTTVGYVDVADSRVEPADEYRVFTVEQTIQLNFADDTAVIRFELERSDDQPAFRITGHHMQE